MIHCGSRGLGHQVCDGLPSTTCATCPAKYGIALPDRQLVCAPVDSPEGQQYLGAMRAAANFAWCNRQLLATQVRRTLERFFGQSERVAGPAAGVRRGPQHRQDRDARRSTAGQRSCACTARAPRGRSRRATRSCRQRYRPIGQPVLIPGDMGRASYVLLGTQGAMEQTLRQHLPRRRARAVAARRPSSRPAGRRIDKELAAQGIIARARGRTGLAEEQPAAYKDVDEVVDCVAAAGLSRKVARLKPMGVIKG